jgi:transposase
MSSSVNFWVGLDVHKDPVTAAVFRNRDCGPVRVDRLPYDLRKIRRYFQRLQVDGTVRACYEASGAGYLLQRSLTAPSLSPRHAGEHRNTDRRDAIKNARDFRDDRLVLIHIPTERDERVRDLVRCRETLQRKIVKSRHYVLKFMRRRGLVFLFHRLAARKPKQVAVTAVARELVGFLWAVLHDVDVSQLQEVDAVA